MRIRPGPSPAPRRPVRPPTSVGLGHRSRRYSSSRSRIRTRKADTSTRGRIPQGGPHRGRGHPREFPEFEGTHQPKHIARADGRGRERIHLPQPFVEERAARPRRLGSQPRSDGGVPRFARELPLQERPQVEARTPHQDRQAAAGMDLSHQGSGPPGELERRKHLRRVTDIQQMMRHGASVRRGRFAGPDVDPAVHLHGVGHDDLGRRARRDGQCRVATSPRRWDRR